MPYMGRVGRAEHLAGLPGRLLAWQVESHAPSGFAVHTSFAALDSPHTYPVT